MISPGFQRSRSHRVSLQVQVHPVDLNTSQSGKVINNCDKIRFNTAAPELILK